VRQTEFDNDAFFAALIPVMIVGLALAVFTIVAMWRLFTKAGQPGWAAIVPIYNTYVLLKVVGRPGWWLVLFFVPIANIVFLVLVMVDLARTFGKDGGFAVLLVFLPMVGMAILGFGDARYLGPVADPAYRPAGARVPAAARLSAAAVRGAPRTGAPLTNRQAAARANVCAVLIELLPNWRTAA
jgi:hypothetical protein